MMKLAVLYDHGEESLVKKIEGFLSPAGVSFSSFALDELNDPGAVQRALGLDGALFFFQKGREKNSWFLYILGTYAGSRKPAFIYRPRQTALPEVLRLFSHSAEPRELFDWLMVMRDGWRREKLFQECRDRVEALGIHFDNSGLFYSVEEGLTEVMETFLTAGFSPNQRNSKGVTLLAIAIRKGYSAIAETLILQGADVNRISKDRNNSPLMEASAEGNEELVELLLDHGARCNIQSKSGQTALVLAIDNGKDSIAEKLLKFGADPDIADKLGMSARKYAKLFKRDKILEVLETHGPID